MGGGRGTKVDAARGAEGSERTDGSDLCAPSEFLLPTVGAGAVDAGMVHRHPDRAGGQEAPLPGEPGGLQGAGQGPHLASLLDDKAKALLSHDVRKKTSKLYHLHFEKFTEHCVVDGRNPLTCPAEVVVNFSRWPRACWVYRGWGGVCQGCRWP